MIRIALSTDLRGFHINATLIASVLRRASEPVHVRCWCRGFLPESFEKGSLKVEFIAANEEVPGTFAPYVGTAVFDRLRVIKEADDWDRCLIMDYDQIALCDLAPLFRMELGDHLLAAKMQGRGVNMAYAMREWIRKPFPPGWEHVADHPYFSMGPLLNLQAMREAGTWDRLMAAQAAFRVDENLALVAATEGRTTAFDDRWNLFPECEITGEEIPDGVIHWVGWPKPWHAEATVWRPEIWEAERSSWEHLRAGLWEKPVAIEVDPDDDRGVEELLRRGWKVHLFAGGGQRQLAEMQPLRFPDLAVEEAEPLRMQSLIAALGEQVARIRFGPWVCPGDWLEPINPLPAYVAVRGPLDSLEIGRLQALGYGGECRLKYSDWPPGGPLSRVLDFARPSSPAGLDAAGEIHLKWEAGSARRISSVKLSSTRAGGLPRRATEPEKVAVIVVAIGKQRRHLRHFLLNLRKNFLPAHPLHVFLFTDGENADEEDITVIRVATADHARARLSVYSWILQEEARIEGFSHLYLMKPTMRIVGEIDRRILADLVAALHSEYVGQPRHKLLFESNEDSVAWVHPDEGSRYFCGSLQGGAKNRFLAAVRSIADGISHDRTRQVLATWGEESHWNRYLIDEPPSLILGPEYAWRTMGKSPGFEPKVAIVDLDPALTEEETKRAGGRRRRPGRG